MDSLTKMTKAVNQLLNEAQLRDAITELTTGDKMKVVLANGEIYRYTIQSTVGGNFIIKSVSNEKEYVFGVEDYRDGNLTVREYTGGLGDEGNEATYPIKYLAMGRKNGEVDIIKPLGNEPEGGSGEEEEQIDYEWDKVKDDLNSDLKQAKAGDMLHFTLIIPDEDGNDGEDTSISFGITKRTDEFIELNLADIEGNKSQYFSDNLNNKNIIINMKNPVKLEGEELSLDVVVKDSGKEIPFTIPHIASLSINEFKSSRDGDEEVKPTLSKEKLMDIISKDEDYKNMWYKSPGLRGTIAGASPTGIYQVQQIMKKSKLNNAYLTVDTRVRFILVDGKVTGHHFNKTKTLDPNHEGGYVGRILRDRVIIVDGKKNNLHWEIELVDETSSNVYDVKIYFAINENKRYFKKKGIIEITDIMKKAKK